MLGLLVDGREGFYPPISNGDKLQLRPRLLLGLYLRLSLMVDVREGDQPSARVGNKLLLRLLFRLFL